MSETMNGGGRSLVLRPPEAVLLDVDDTLVEWTQTVPIALAMACRKTAAEVGIDAELLEAIVSHLWRSGLPVPDAGCLERGLSRLGADVPSNFEEILGEIPGDRLAALKPVEGAAAAVREIRNRVEKLGIVTSGEREVQSEKVRLLGLGDVFDVFVTSVETGLTKDKGEIYELALSRLGVQVTNTWMVGDSLDWDVASAQSVGMKGIWVVWPASKYREMKLAEQDLPQNSSVVPDLIVKHLRDLLPYLRDQ